MPRKFPAITLTDSVRDVQTRYQSRANEARVAPSELDDEPLGREEIEFIRERDGFYLATVNEDGWPYIQFRGGPTGFVKALSPTALGYADFRGNRQYISMGNISSSERVSLFFMDYSHQRRLKVLARASYTEGSEDAALLAAVSHDDYSARVERVVRFDIVAFDWNCPQHITPRFTRREFRELGL